tara:strand:- start:307 stop:567 length:261 start_codon:yes stop_codon:yes gene_type:complete
MTVHCHPNCENIIDNAIQGKPLDQDVSNSNIIEWASWACNACNWKDKIKEGFTDRTMDNPPPEYQLVAFGLFTILLIISSYKKKYK